MVTLLIAHRCMNSCIKVICRRIELLIITLYLYYSEVDFKISRIQYQFLQLFSFWIRLRKLGLKKKRNIFFQVRVWFSISPLLPKKEFNYCTLESDSLSLQEFNSSTSRGDFRLFPERNLFLELWYANLSPYRNSFHQHWNLIFSSFSKKSLILELWDVIFPISRKMILNIATRFILLPKRI